MHTRDVTILSIHFAPCQTQYVAWLLSRRMTVDSADLLVTTLVEAQIDLNPHQMIARFKSLKQANERNTEWLARAQAASAPLTTTSSLALNESNGLERSALAILT